MNVIWQKHYLSIQFHWAKTLLEHSVSLCKSFTWAFNFKSFTWALRISTAAKGLFTWALLWTLLVTVLIRQAPGCHVRCTIGATRSCICRPCASFAAGKSTRRKCMFLKFLNTVGLLCYVWPTPVHSQCELCCEEVWYLDLLNQFLDILMTNVFREVKKECMRLNHFRRSGGLCKILASGTPGTSSSRDPCIGSLTMRPITARCSCHFQTWTLWTLRLRNWLGSGL